MPPPALLPEPMEQPLYILTPKTSRVLIPSSISLLFLDLLFYLGILLNISLLQLSGNQETVLKTASLMLLLALIILGIFLSWHKSGPYVFYPAFLQCHHKNIPYTSITTPHLKKNKNVFDHFFHTYSLDLGNKFIIKYIPEEIDLPAYITQLRQYGQGKY